MKACTSCKTILKDHVCTYNERSFCFSCLYLLTKGYVAPTDELTIEKIDEPRLVYNEWKERE
jgi:hypothetical protein